MKRRIIKNGRAYLSSLPIDWVREQGLKSKDVIDVVKLGNKLIITPKSEKKLKRTRLDSKNILSVLQRFILALYRDGCDEIEILYEGDEALKHIRDVLDKELIGFEIVEQKESSCVIKDISNHNPNAFDNLLRRCFLLVTMNAKDCSKGLKNKNITILKEISQRDKGINKLTTYCERLLVKNTELGSKKNIYLFKLVKDLENLADDYKYLTEHCLKTKKFGTNKEISLLDKINIVLDKVHSSFYDFKEEEVAKLEIEMKKLKVKLLAFDKDYLFGYRLMNIFKRLHVMLGGHYCLKLGEN